MENFSQHFSAALAAQPAPELLWALLVSGRCELPLVPNTSCALQAPGLWESWELFWVLLQDKLPVQKCLQVFPSSHPLCAQAVIARQLTGRIYCLLVLTMQTLPGFASLYFVSLFVF